MTKKKIVILGDSLSFGYLPMGQGQMNPNLNWPKKLANLLKTHYQSQYDFEIVINAQPGRTITKPLIDFGFTQDNASDKIDNLLHDNSPFDVLIVFLGTNDYFGFEALHHDNAFMKPSRITEIVVNNLGELVEKIISEAAEKYQYHFKPLIIIPPKALLQSGVELLQTFPKIYQAYFDKKNIDTVNLQVTANPQREDLVNFDGIHYVPQDTDEVAKAIFNKMIEKNFFS